VPTEAQVGDEAQIESSQSLVDLLQYQHTHPLDQPMSRKPVNEAPPSKLQGILAKANK